MTLFYMRQAIMAECAQLSQFDEELHRVTGESPPHVFLVFRVEGLGVVCPSVS